MSGEDGQTAHPRTADGGAPDAPHESSAEPSSAQESSGGGESAGSEPGAGEAPSSDDGAGDAPATAAVDVRAPAATPHSPDDLGAARTPSAAPGPARRSRLRRALEIAVPLVVAIVAALILFRLRTPLGYRFHASSAQSPYKRDGWSGTLRSGNVFFHTANEKNPWVELRLPKPTKIHEVKVWNRESFPERAVPLVVEVAEPDGTYRAVARRDKSFKRFAFEFQPVETTKVRLRVDGRKTWLHLERVTID